jgi:hypothetical protein
MRIERGNLLKRHGLHPLSRAPTWCTAAVIVAGFVFSMAASLPGQLSYDSVIQLFEGRTAVYHGWHPPVMSWLLGLADSVVPGTGVFAAGNALLLFGAMLSLPWLVPKVSWAAPLVAALCVLTPQLSIYQGIVWKDVLFANAVVAGFIALAHLSAQWRNAKVRYALLAAALLLLTLAALSRQNGIVLLLFGAGAVVWIARRNGAASNRGWLWGGGALAGALVALVCADAALGTRVTGDLGLAKQVRLLEFYDLNGALAAQPHLPLPELERDHPALLQAMKSDGRRLYSPVRSDALAGSGKLQGALAHVPDDTLHRPWLGFVLHHPGIYLRTRAAIFRWLVLTPNLDLCVPYVVGVDGPPKILRSLGVEPRYSPRDEFLDDYATRFLGTPLFSHATFLAIILAELGFFLFRRRSADVVFAIMLLGIVIFSASFFFISLACDYRYLYVIDLGALIGLLYLALDPGRAALSGMRRGPE